MRERFECKNRTATRCVCEREKRLSFRLTCKLNIIRMNYAHDMYPNPCTAIELFRRWQSMYVCARGMFFFSPVNAISERLFLLLPSYVVRFNGYSHFGHKIDVFCITCMCAAAHLTICKNSNDFSRCFECFFPRRRFVEHFIRSTEYRVSTSIRPLTSHIHMIVSQ